MTSAATYLRCVWRLVRKDARRECRARMTWPAVLLLGFTLVLTLELQADFPVDVKRQFVGSLLWLAMFFAGTLSLERSFADENDNGCWDALRMCPVPPAAIYTAKLAFNFAMLMAAAAVLIPLLTVLSDAAFFDRPLAMLLVTVLANLGLAAVGTLIGAMVGGVRRRSNLIVLLLLPLIMPVMLGAGEATRLVIQGKLDEEFWRWIQLVAAFDVLFVTASLLFFEFVMEE
jgi:heme exporter protein B